MWQPSRPCRCLDATDLDGNGSRRKHMSFSIKKQAEIVVVDVEEDS